MRWLDKLCVWYLRSRGYKVGDELGVTLMGNCVATGTKYDMQVSNPSGRISVGWGSITMLEEEAPLSQMPIRVE